jgi:nitrite reductase/ring-hydroxylating ferredoxin subunit
MLLAGNLAFTFCNVSARGRAARLANAWAPIRALPQNIRQGALPKMLSAVDNKLITQVGPGTLMGSLFRRYWLPAMLSEELPEPDCAPVKLRLLGEDLLAFRMTSGAVAVVDRWCPHRNANLYWGRNEEEGIRCVYHGWKFDGAGQCVDMPNEPAASTFASKIRIPSYQAVERGGVIWVHMGPQEHEPAIPELEWLNVPETHRVVSKRIQFCNWLQNLEGEVDSSHVSFLHSNLGADAFRAVGGSLDRHPVFSVLTTDWGVAVCARRDAPDDQYYWRITPFMMPSYTIVPGPMGGASENGASGGQYLFTAAVPIDDLNMIGISVVWNPDAPVSAGPLVPVDNNYVPLQRKDNDFLIDRVAQKTSSYTGIDNIRVQDIAVQEDQKGPLSDRTTEHLGSADLGVIATRHRLLNQARALVRGTEPPEPHNPRVYDIRSLAMSARREEPWQDLMERYMVRKEPARTQRIFS